MARDLKKTDAQNRSVWRLGSKTRLTVAREKTSQIPGKQIYLTTLLKQMDDNDDDDNSFSQQISLGNLNVCTCCGSH